MTTPRRLALIAALALIPVVPYASLRYTGQDLPFHVGSWLDLREAWRSGQFSPGWSMAANFGRGDPHLTFYPPVSFFLGALLTLLLPLSFAPAAFAWIAFVLGGFSMYAASKPFVADRDRLSAAILYMLGPYTLTTSLVRFAAAELLVQAWLPLIALFFYQAVWVRTIKVSQSDWNSSRALILLGFLLGLSWITNIPASIVLLYSLAIVALFCALLQRSVTPLLRIGVAEVIAASLAAFHLLPVWRERAWIHSGTLLRIDPLQLLLFMPHYNFNDSPLLVACWIFLCAQVLLAIVCLRKRTLPFSSDPAVPAWACWAAASFLLQSPLAIPFWQHAPELRFVQFPLRFLSVIGVAIPLLLLSRGTRTSLRRPAYILTALLSLMPFVGYLSEQAVPSNRTAPSETPIASWQSQGAPEYLPAGTITPVGPADFPAVSSVDPSNPLAADLACHVELERHTPNLRTIRTLSTAACRLRLTTYFYPSWRATDESHQALKISRESTGFLLIDVPPGSHVISLAFRAESPIRTASAMLSSIAFVLVSSMFLVSLAVDRKASRRRATPVVP